jgi:ABC-type sugar transport system ATPase subunit
MSEDYILEMKNITKRFGTVLALENMNISVKRGTIHAICGENGAGKSTLMKVLHGYHPYGTYEGEIYLDGKLLRSNNTVDSQNAGIAMVYQEIDCLGTLTVSENIFASQMIYNKFGLLDYKAMHRECAKVFESIGLDIDPRTLMGKLNTSQQQLVMFAKAVRENAKVIILDEPTSSITKTEVSRMMEVIRKLKSEGVTFCYITHKLDEVFELADACTVIRDGKSIGTLDKSEFDMNRIITMMVGRDIGDVYPKHTPKLGEEKLRVEHLVIPHKRVKGRNVVNDVSFSLKKGEILGLAGMVGAGRSEIINGIYGALKRTSGDFFIDGKPAKIECVRDAMSYGISLLSEDRHESGLFLQDKTVKNNLVASILPKLKEKLFLSEKKVNDAADRMMTELQIKADGTDSRVTSLSGGNQQKVVLGRCLLAEPTVLLLDEPTRGVDVGTKNQIYHLIYKLADAGISIIVISSELPELVNICDRFLVIAGGEVKGELSREEVSEEAIMKYAVQ